MPVTLLGADDFVKGDLRSPAMTVAVQQSMAVQRSRVRACTPATPARAAARTPRPAAARTGIAAGSGIGRYPSRPVAESFGGPDVPDHPCAARDDSFHGRQRRHCRPRLRKYTGREPGHDPVTEHAQARTQDRLDAPGLTGPWIVELEQNLANQPRYLAGIRDLFVNSGLKGWEKDLRLLESQLAAHEKWLRAELMRRARATNHLPPEIYADKLRNFGVKADPATLIDQALLSFVQSREEMQTLATLVAKERGYPLANYRAVLARLKQDVIPQDDLLPT
jgi:hypothetical protein